MACNDYLPIFQRQLNPADPLGSSNCTTYSAAMAGDYHTCGSRGPSSAEGLLTGERVRYLTGDKTGGTTLLQVDTALNRGWGIDLSTRIGAGRLTWNEFVNHINSGRGAILQGGYSAIQYTRFSGSRTFGGNHAIFVPPKWKAADPLADGRREGIYKYKGEPYPQYILKDFAGKLVLDPITGRRLGYGYVWAALTKDNTSDIVHRWRVRVPAGTFIRYRMHNSIIQGYEKRRTGGFGAYCTAPRVYKAKSGLPFAARTLVKIESGAYKGWFVSATRYAREI